MDMSISKIIDELKMRYKGLRIRAAEHRSSVVNVKYQLESGLSGESLFLILPIGKGLDSDPKLKAKADKFYEKHVMLREEEEPETSGDVTSIWPQGGAGQ